MGEVPRKGCSVCLWGAANTSPPALSQARMKMDRLTVLAILSSFFWNVLTIRIDLSCRRGGWGAGSALADARRHKRGSWGIATLLLCLILNSRSIKNCLSRTKQWDVNILGWVGLDSEFQIPSGWVFSFFFAPQSLLFWNNSSWYEILSYC